MRKSPLFFAALIALAFSASSLSAQSPPTRHGFFFGAGIGLGAAQLNCGTGCGSNPANDISGYAHIGATINPHFRVGLESNAWFHTVDGADQQVAFYTGALYFYPSVSNNIWLKGGVGFASAKATDGVDEVKADGVGGSVAIGYDWAVSRSNFVIVPFAGYLRLMNGKAKFDGTDIGGITATVDLFQFGIGLGYRH